MNPAAGALAPAPGRLAAARVRRAEAADVRDVEPDLDEAAAGTAPGASDARDAVVTFPRPDRHGAFGVHTHRAKLEQGEDAAMLTDAFLAIEHRLAGFEPHREGGQRHGNGRENQPDE